MSLSMGIVGLPNVGKSTLFNALTQKRVSADNYPFCTIEPSVGVVSVPDERLDALAAFSASAKRVPAAVEFVDIAGLVKGAAHGEGLGNQFLSNIRETDAIAQVVRVFEDDNITHVHGEVNPLRDIEIITMELILADLESVERRLDKIARDVKRGDKEAVFEDTVLRRVKELLERERPAREAELDEREMRVVRSLHLITMKPTLYVLNRKSGGRNLESLNDTRYDELMAFLEKGGHRYVTVDAAAERELSGLDEEERAQFRVELGVDGGDGVNDLIREAYRMLGLITFFTTGPDETRGWTITEGSTAPMAGAAIHTDFKDKFIRAEVIPWRELLDAGSFAAAREQGLVRTEGKEYVVQDGDVVEFKI